MGISADLVRRQDHGRSGTHGSCSEEHALRRAATPAGRQVQAVEQGSREEGRKIGEEGRGKGGAALNSSAFAPKKAAGGGPRGRRVDRAGGAG